MVLNLDINLEEKTVEIFAENIIKAGKYFCLNLWKNLLFPLGKELSTLHQVF